MREMKDSGVEWIGEIPKDWEVHPVYAYFEEGKTKNYRMQEQNLLSLSYGRIIRKDINTNGGLLPASFNTYNVVEAGDIIIRPTDLQNDKRSLRTGLVKEQGIITSAYIDLRPKDNVNSKYYHYLLHSYDVIKVFYNMGNGVRQGLNFSEFAKLLLLEPTTVEQQQIADYLDTKCSEIDATAEDIQKEISLLEEYKKSVITEAVTKGLNPDAEMKDSGIEWIGQIPKHWKVVRLEFLSWVRARLGWKGLKADEYVDEGYPFLSAFNIQDSKIKWEPLNFITKERFDESPEIMVACGDVLLLKDGAGVGKCARIDSLPKGDSTVNSSLAVITCFDNLNYRYLYYSFNSSFFSNLINLKLNGMGVPHLTQEELRKFIVLLPCVKEQQQIADFLDTKCSEIDAIIADKKRQRGILAEYKKSLIYEYVTGKKEVPVHE